MINNKVLIIDVSFWQDDNTTPQKIDFVKMKEAGADGVIIKIGQGNWVDSDFVDNFRLAKEAGLPVGVYWFWDSRYSPKTQSDTLINALPSFPELGIWGDFEEHYFGAYGGFANYKSFMSNLEAAYPGKLVGNYTAYYYWLDNTSPNDREYAKKWKLWIAHYGVSSPSLPYPWTSYLFWQYTDSGDGIAFGAESLNIDMSYFYGTLEEYKNYFNLGGVTNPPTGGTMQEGTVITTSLKIRTGPGTQFPESYPPMGGLRNGDKVYGQVDLATNWMHFSKIVRVTGETELHDGWSSAVGWNTATPLYMTVKDYVDPTVPTDTIESMVFSGEVTVQYLDGRPDEIFSVSNVLMVKR